MDNVNFNKDQEVEAYNFPLNFNLKFATLFHIYIPFYDPEIRVEIFVELYTSTFSFCYFKVHTNMLKSIYEVSEFMANFRNRKNFGTRVVKA